MGCKLTLIGEGRFPWRVTYGELRELVRKAAAAMSEMGITVGDRVVGYLPNCLEAVVAMLACTSLGALWRYSYLVGLLLINEKVLHLRISESQ